MSDEQTLRIALTAVGVAALPFAWRLFLYLLHKLCFGLGRCYLLLSRKKSGNAASVGR